MVHERSIRRYRYWYARLLRLYARPHHERFGQGMEQTFNDLLRERAGKGKGLLGLTFRVFAETSAAIIGEKMTLGTSRTRKIMLIALVTATLLLVPLIAMQFTDEVNWDLADFLVAGVLLFGAGLTYELIARKAGSIAYRTAVGLAVATGLLLMWMNLAVGLIGNEENPANLMYVGVLGVGLIGAFIARLQPQGMVRALLATAVAQMLVAVIAQIAGLGFTFILNGFFAVLWVLSALMFQRASATESSDADSLRSGQVR